MLRGFLLVLTVIACKGEPQRSYCEALCDWAVSCQATEREVDAAALTSACLDATMASDPGCAKAEAGELNIASAKLLEPCVNAIDDAALAEDCNGFVGSVDELKIGTAPAKCLSQAEDAVQTYEVARDATTETGAELCARYTDTFCGRAESCILGDFAGDIPQSAIDALGGTPFELCVQRLAPVFTDDCVANDLYKAEESFTAVNAPRQAARECLVGFESIACDDLMTGDVEGKLSPTCVASVSNPADLVALGQALLTLSQDFAQYAR